MNQWELKNHIAGLVLQALIAKWDKDLDGVKGHMETLVDLSYTYADLMVKKTYSLLTR